MAQILFNRRRWRPSVNALATAGSVYESMSERPYPCRSMGKALADLCDKRDRIPEASARTRPDLDRMINGLKAEIAEREARAAAGR
jgi:hypothetical protein